MINQNKFRYDIALSDRERRDEERYIVNEVIWMTEKGAHEEDIGRWLEDYASEHYLKVFASKLSESEKVEEQKNLVCRTLNLTKNQTRKYLEKVSDNFLSAKDCPVD